MRSVRIERRAHRQNALRTLGINPEQARTFVTDVRAAGLESDLLSLPFYLGEQQPLQDENGVTLFMVGISPAGGSDKIGAP